MKKKFIYVISMLLLLCGAYLLAEFAIVMRNKQEKIIVRRNHAAELPNGMVKNTQDKDVYHDFEDDAVTAPEPSENTGDENPELTTEELKELEKNDSVRNILAEIKADDLLKAQAIKAESSADSLKMDESSVTNNSKEKNNYWDYSVGALAIFFIFLILGYKSKKE